MAEDEEELKPEEEKDDSRLFIGIGVAGTFIWSVIFVALYIQTDLPVNWGLNHLGDFLAGVFAPLAVFWFVLAFFLQIKEIRYQRIEINRLGSFTERQAKASEKHVALGEKELEKGNKDVRPRLLYINTGTGSDRNGAMITINFKNVGGTAYGFKINTTAANLAGLVCPKVAVEQDQSSIIRFIISTTNHLPQPLTITYLDLDKNEYIHEGLISNEDEKNRKFFDEQKLMRKID